MYFNREKLRNISLSQTTLHARFKEIQEENQLLKVKLESQKESVNERQRQSGLKSGQYFVTTQCLGREWWIMNVYDQL